MRTLPTPRSHYGNPSTGAVTGAVAAASSSIPHVDPEGFLGLNWKSIGVTVFVAVLTAVATDTVLTEWHGYRKKRKAP
jgi:hypothetical protein